MIIIPPNDFALITALYRSSIEGRRFMYEAILSEDGNFEIPDSFTSRAVNILQVYLKSLGVRMQTINSEDEYIGEPGDSENIVAYTFGNKVIFTTPDEMFYIKQLTKQYRWYLKDTSELLIDFQDIWDKMVENLPFKKKHLTDNIINLFKNNINTLIGD